MTLQNRDTSTFDRDDAFVASDVELDEAELMLAEDEETPKSSAVSASERIIDDK
jgi:RNA polymerase nonessential primary-like sigma factor